MTDGDDAGPLEGLPPLYLYELARRGITADLREQAIAEIHRRTPEHPHDHCYMEPVHELVRRNLEAT